MPRVSKLLHEARRQLAASRDSARKARTLIEGSRRLLSRTEDTVVATASCLSAARAILAGPYGPKPLSRMQ